MELYHASKEIVKYPEIRKAKYTKDFSWGFYCTNNMQQAVRWANRGMGEPIINYYDYQFWALAEFKYPTHQISFHTLSALDCLTFLKSEVIYDR